MTVQWSTGSLYRALNASTLEKTEGEKRSLCIARAALEVRLNARVPTPAIQNAATVFFVRELGTVVTSPSVDSVDFKGEIRR